MNKYQLIHIDTLESVMCEKIIIDGNDYYVIKTDDLDMFTYYVDIIENTIEFEGDSDEIDVNPNWRKIIATTNPSIKCPQVVDYGLYLAEQEYPFEEGYSVADKNYSIGELQDSFNLGYQQYSETHSLSDEEVKILKNCILYLNSLPYPTDEHEAECFVEQVKNETSEALHIIENLPIKVYYR